MTATNHPLQGKGRHVQSLGVGLARRSGGGPVPHQEFQIGRMGELGGTTEAAMLGIEAVGKLLAGIGSAGRVGDGPWPGLQLGQGLHEGRVLLLDGRALLPVGLRNLFQQVGEAGQSVTLLRGEIGAGEEGPQVAGHQEDRERPAPSPARQ